MGFAVELSSAFCSRLHNIRCVGYICLWYYLYGGSWIKSIDFIVEDSRHCQISLALSFLELSLAFCSRLHNTHCVGCIRLWYYLYNSSGIGNVDYIVECNRHSQISLALSFLELSLAFCSRLHNTHCVECIHL